MCRSRRVFAELSVYDNLMMGAYTRKDKKEIAETLAMVYKRFPRLEERKKQMAGTLSVVSSRCWLWAVR